MVTYIVVKDSGNVISREAVGREGHEHAGLADSTFMWPLQGQEEVVNPEAKVLVKVNGMVIHARQPSMDWAKGCKCRSRVHSEMRGFFGAERDAEESLEFLKD
jgi:hypothetical protein